MRLRGNRVAKIFRAPRDRVLIDVLIDRFHRAALDVIRRGEIREALREVHGAVLQRLARHLPNHRLGKRTRFFRYILAL